jgi:threonine-phosphate decarboxylase
MIEGHGDDAYRYQGIKVNFSSNVYNHFCHEGLFCHLADKLDNVVSYPEPAPTHLEESLALLLGLQKDEVCVTNGATEAIYLIAQTFRRSQSAILMPTFSEYRDACQLHEHKIQIIYNCQLSTVKAAIEREKNQTCSSSSEREQARTKFNSQLFWLCNPNNPTGSVLDKEQLAQSIEKHTETLFVLDASYAPFTEEPLLTAAEACQYPNVLMLHSMTKKYAIPGLRLGYITAHKNLLAEVRLQRMPWSVNQVAIDAGFYLLAHSDEFRLPLHELMLERQRVAERLTALGCIEVWPSQTHILLCKLRMGRAAALKEYLATEHGLLIRDAGNFVGLDDSFFRIAVQEKTENDSLLHAIEEWLCL